MNCLLVTKVNRFKATLRMHSKEACKVRLDNHYRNVMLNNTVLPWVNNIYRYIQDTNRPRRRRFLPHDRFNPRPRNNSFVVHFKVELGCTRVSLIDHYFTIEILIQPPQDFGDERIFC